MSSRIRTRADDLDRLLVAAMRRRDEAKQAYDAACEEVEDLVQQIADLPMEEE